MPDQFDANLYFDSNGCLTERTSLGGQEVIVHYEDIPETDITVHRGIRVTTALRTVIDIGPDIDPDHLRLIVQDCLRRHLFTIEEAVARLAEPDMVARAGAVLLAQALAEVPF